MGLEFVWSFIPTITHTNNESIIVDTKYYTKWVEEKVLRDNTAMSTAKFVYEYLWCRFGCPIELISDQGGHFLNQPIRDLTTHYALVHKKSTSYYPQVNGLAESTNKTVNQNRTNCDDKLHSAL